MGVDIALLSDILDDKCGFFGLTVYSVEEMQRKFARWWTVNGVAWQKLHATTLLEYDPIANFDRHETSEDVRTVRESGENSGTRTAQGEQSSTINNESSTERSGSTSDTRTDEQTASAGTETTEEKRVAAYNEEVYSAKDKTSTTGATDSSTESSSTAQSNFSEENSENGEQTATSDSSETSTDSGTYQKEFEEKTEHSATLRGNIGVTTTQQMIEAEREIVQFNLYDHIATAFKERFCVMIY